MTVPAIAAIGSVTGTSALSGLSGIDATGLDASTAAPAAGATSGTDFAKALTNGLNSVQEAQSKADDLAVGAATGNLTDISQYSIAATQASLMTELATSIRTKGVEAFNQIMNMQA